MWNCDTLDVRGFVSVKPRYCETEIHSCALQNQTTILIVSSDRRFKTLYDTHSVESPDSRKLIVYLQFVWVTFISASLCDAKA